MSEAARILRLVVPGALFLTLYGLWFALDSRLAGRDLPGVSAGAAALAGGATIPLGFVAQMIAAEITWWQCPRWLQWLGLRWRPLRTIDNRGVVREVHEADCCSKTDVQLVSIVDFQVHQAYRRDESPHGLWRLRSLTDMYQGLGNGAVATGMALLAMLTTAPATAWWLGDDPLNWSRGFLLIAGVVACGLLFWGMCVSHQRVVTIAQEMVVEILRDQEEERRRARRQ